MLYVPCSMLQISLASRSAAVSTLASQFPKFYYFRHMMIKRVHAYKLVLALCSLLLVSASYTQWKGNTSPTYAELIMYLEKVDKEHQEVELYNMGSSDYGLPIYVCVINGAQDSLQTFQKARRSTTILINNAIHPGEPDGINACLIWMDEWIRKGKKNKDLPVIAFIPAYNVDGMMVRSSSSRANQNGPEEYGFRGNAQNLDLNRDFIKMDSENTFTFARIYHALDPDVFVDTHVSNGADYQYTLTLISSMKERLAPEMRRVTYDHLLPDLCESLRKKYKTDLFPYVELKGETPETGLEAFNDLPRYAMGYASLFNAFSFTVETHMLKAFPARVEVTRQFIDELILWTSVNANLIEETRKRSRFEQATDNYFRFAYQLTDQKDSVLFKGFEHSYPISEVNGKPRLFYDRTKPYTRYIPHYNTYVPMDSAVKPQFFIVGAQCRDVIARLKANDIAMKPVLKDTVVKVMITRVISFNSSSNPYEGHYLHSKVQTVLEEQEVRLKPGDVWISTDQKNSTFLHAVLQPKAEDSYFAWNFFDSYVQQKEYFSAYVFEDRAAEILRNDPALKLAFEEKKRMDEKFRDSSWEQLYYIYRNSSNFEPSWHRLPVYQIMK